MKTKQITEFGLFLAVSLVLAYLESLLPVMIAVPGVKLGLANILTLFILYRMDWKHAFFFMTVRVVIAGLLFSGMFGILYSFAGGVFSVFIMNLTKRFSFFSILGVSMSGAVFHNLGQILMAMLVMENVHIMYYFPVLCISGLVSGLLIGFLGSFLYSQYNKIFPKD